MNTLFILSFILLLTIAMEIHGVSNELSKWTHGGLEPTPINILRLISELEGVYQLTKYMAFDEDNAIIDSMKQRYYKLYYDTNKKTKVNGSPVHQTNHTIDITIQSMVKDLMTTSNYVHGGFNK